MFERLARFSYRRRWYVVGAWLLVMIVGLGLTLQVNSVLGPGDFTQKGSDSAKAAAILDGKFHQNPMKTTLVVIRSSHDTIHSAAFHQAVETEVARLRADRSLRINYLDNPLASDNRQLIARDGHGLAILFSSALKESDIEGKIVHLRGEVRLPNFTTYVTGDAAGNHDSQVQSEKDISHGDSIVIPIMILVLLLVFGTLVASSLPLVLAICSIILSMAMVYIFGHFVNTSVYVLNVVIALGLGVGIDYSLFIVYRFREELKASDVETALVRTMATTGRAIFFSGLTVAIGLSSLILSGVPFMQSMGLGGMLVPLTALAVAMSLLPALLAILGHKINRFRVVPVRFLQTGTSGLIHRWTMAIMRRPVIAGGLVLVILLGLAFPVTQLNRAFSGLKNAPKNLESIAGEVYIQQHFPTAPDPIQIVVQTDGHGAVTSTGEIKRVRAFEQHLRHDADVANVSGPGEYTTAGGQISAAELRQITGRYVSADRSTALISVVGHHDVGSKQTDDLVMRIRAQTAAAFPGNSVYVGGAQASDHDFDHALYAHFPLIVGMVLLLTYGFLFYAFRSAFLPLKAVLLNLLSVLAAYGSLQLVFQRGIGSAVLGFYPESGVAGWVPVFLFAFLFGLSMDYEVFLLSRVREGWLATRDNEQAVAFGLEKTGRLISSAAAIMVIAFSGFILGTEVELKEFGFGLVISIAIDATLIRLVLVPAIMRVMGNANWWVPAPLRRFADGGALSEGEVPAEIAA
jgi:RND superfamily putative drug exporter